MKKYVLIFCLMSILLSCSGDRNKSPENQGVQEAKPSGIVFKKHDYGEKWPFSVDQIEVFCAGYHEIYFKTAGGVYTLNGSAKTSSKGNPLFHSAEEIWLNDPANPEIKIELPGEFISKGLELCKD